jgi:hypothetical protein
VVEILTTGAIYPTARKKTRGTPSKRPDALPTSRNCSRKLRRLTRLLADSDAQRNGRMVNLMADDKAYAFARVAARTRVAISVQHLATSGHPAYSARQFGSRGRRAMLQTASARPRRAKTFNGEVEVRLAAHSAALYR